MNQFNRERHEKKFHEEKEVEKRPKSPRPRSPAVSSPRITRQRKQNATSNRSEWRRLRFPNSKSQIFDFDNDPHARQLRDKTMEEINNKFAAKNKRAADERRTALEERQRTLREKNDLAAENEKRRQEKAAEMQLRSQRAIDKLVESRKRRR